MTERTLKLGGRKWALPALPWGICEQIEPVIFEFFPALATANFDYFRLDRELIGRMASAAFVAAKFVDPDLTREMFDTLAFGTNDLVKAAPVLALAVGMELKGGEQSKEKPLGELSAGQN